MALNRFNISTDTGAPTLSGTAGDLVTVLDAVLVNGFNSGSCTITRSGSTATATRTSHGFRDKAAVQIAGASETEYNGVHRITVLDANTFTFEVSGTPATPATGSITCKQASLGWTTLYTGTNKRVYQQGAGSNGFVLRVDDTGTMLGIVRMAESATDVDTLVDPFPTTAQVATYSVIHKSTAASSTTRAWIIQGDEASFNMFVYSTGSTGYGHFSFGDLFAFDVTDAFATICAPAWGSGTGNQASGWIGQSHPTANYASTTFSAATIGASKSFAIARAADQTTKSVGGTCYTPLPFTASSDWWGKTSSNLPLRTIAGTNRVALDGIVTDNTRLRGRVRGILNPVENLSSGTLYDGEDYGQPAGSQWYSVAIFENILVGGQGSMLVQYSGELE